MSSVHGSPFQVARAYLKAFPVLMTVKRKTWKVFQKPGSWLYGYPGYHGTTKLNIVSTFPLHAPYTSGNYKDLAEVTIQTINRLIPLLSYFVKIQTGKRAEIKEIDTFPASLEELEAADELKQYLDKYGSDKANSHNYHKLYGPILKSRHRIRTLLEIGIGTNNVDVLSNMGPTAKPGGSLRAFRDFLTNAEIYGADIDTGILFEEERIKTYRVDQIDLRSFENLSRSIPSELDLIIDDGLHSPIANINTLLFGLTRIKIDGWLVIEDIAPDAIPLWEVVAALLPANYMPHLFTAAGAALFAVHRLE